MIGVHSRVLFADPLDAERFQKFLAPLGATYAPDIDSPLVGSSGTVFLDDGGSFEAMQIELRRLGGTVQMSEVYEHIRPGFAQELYETVWKMILKEVGWLNVVRDQMGIPTPWMTRNRTLHEQAFQIATALSIGVKLQVDMRAIGESEVDRGPRLLLVKSHALTSTSWNTGYAPGVTLVSLKEIVRDDLGETAADSRQIAQGRQVLDQLPLGNARSLIVAYFNCTRYARGGFEAAAERDGLTVIPVGYNPDERGLASFYDAGFMTR